MSENKTIDEIGKAFAEFKSANDERLKEIESKGSADSVTSTKVDAINAEITALTNTLSDERKSADERVAKLEAAIQRTELGGDIKDEGLQAEIKSFKDSVCESSKSLVDADFFSEYKKIVGSYIRKGDRTLASDELKALSVGTDTNGGYLVTPDTSGRMVKFIYETSPMRQIANVMSISSDKFEGMRDLGEGSAGWVGETQSRTETDTPSFGQYSIPVHEHYAEPEATQQMLDDASIDVEGWLAEKVADKLSRVENNVFINGNGVSKPRGFLNYGTTTADLTSSTFNVLQHVVSGASGAFASSDGGDALIELVHKLKASMRGNANWLMSGATLAEIRKLKDGNGNYLWQPDFEVRRGGNLLGYSIVEAEDMPEIAPDSFSIAFGDFNRGYQIVDRMGIRVLRDNLTRKPFVKFYTTKRVGGDVINFDAIKLMKFSA